MGFPASVSTLLPSRKTLGITIRKPVDASRTVLDLWDSSGKTIRRVVIPKGFRSTQQLLYKARTGEVDVTQWGYSSVGNGEVVAFDLLGFPVFRGNYVKADININTDSSVLKYGFKNMKSNQHQEAATRIFREAMKTEAQSSEKTLDEYLLSKGFNSTQIKQIKAGDEKISGYTWHHHQETGRMQLVEQKINTDYGHNGGNSLWDDGYSED